MQPALPRFFSVVTVPIEMPIAAPIATPPLRIVVTGARGFIGAALIRTLRDRGHTIQGWARDTGFELDYDAQGLQLARELWQRQLQDVDVVVHLAARVHQRNENKTDIEARYQRINVDATLALAEAARAVGVRRFLFFSSAKVYGEGGDEAYSEAAVPAPNDTYARSKWRAEQGLSALAADSKMELSVLRPPLVYGIGVAGNFHNLWQLAASKWPLPFASIRNRRDMIALDNLADITARCCEDPRAAGKTFNVADATPYSLPEIIRAIRQATNIPALLYPISPALLRKLLRWLRWPGHAQRLFGDFRLDTQRVRNTLDWQPEITLAQAVKQMAEHKSQ